MYKIDFCNQSNNYRLFANINEPNRNFIPAKNLVQGMAVINAGADAVYIGVFNLVLVQMQQTN